MPEHTTTSHAGLFAIGESQSAVPLAGVAIEGAIHGFYAKVVVAQRYVNAGKDPIEAVYLFPLDEGAAVCAFEAIVDGTLVVGEVHEREKAFDIYDEAMEAGHGAFLLDEERPDVFQASIGNLAPGKDVTVRLTYVVELSFDDGRIRFAIPTTVSPRYAPAEDRTGVGRPDQETLNPPVAFSVPYGLNLEIRVAMPQAITGIESPSHPVSLQLHADHAIVTLAQTEAALDRDFVLSIAAPGLDAPQVLVERDDQGEEAVGVAFAPAFAAANAPSEVIFVVDRSGSMEGPSIREVRNALQLCLRSMVPGCRFNIVGFGSRYESLFSESRAYDQSSLEAASAHVAALEADLGGTEILEPLRSVLAAPPPTGLARQVVILTDGQVTNTDAVIALATAHAPTARIFTFGIGAGASHHLVRGLARAGGGAAEFIFPGERIEPKVLRQFSRLLSPALTDVRVDWIDGAVTQSPRRIPPVFAGGRLLLYAFVEKKRPSAVRLTARGPSGPLSFEVPLPQTSADTARTVCTLAARARIRELEESSEWVSARGSRQPRRQANSTRDEITALARRYGLMSRETSFVAVERRDVPVIGDVKLRKVPIALTTGWGGVDRAPLLAAVPSRSSFPPPRLTKKRSVPIGMSEEALLDTGSSDMVAFSRVAPQPVGRASRPPEYDRMLALIVLQAADGSWELTNDLAAILGRDADQLRAFAHPVSGPAALLSRVWATALAVVWLEQHAADFRDEWRALAAKARAFIERASASLSAETVWTDAARRFLRGGG